MEEVGEVMLDINKKQKEDDFDIEGVLGKCSNLKALRISSRNSGPVQKLKWKKVVSGMEELKFLKELYLNIRGCDLPFLTQLFKQKNKAVRQIQKLTLIITDEKELNTMDVSAFVNTMELRSLHLTLSRDNLLRSQMIELLKSVRLSTSMSGLPLNELVLNLTKNKVTETTDITNLFNSQAAKISKRSLTM